MKPLHALALLLASTLALPAQNVPKDSMMATDGASLQKNLVAALENPADARPGGYKFSNGAAVPFEGDLPPEHNAAVQLSGETSPGAGKGDFTVARTIEGTTRYVGAWFHVNPDDNVKSVGVQFHEQTGEYLVVLWPADFVGWKWCESVIDENTFKKDHHGDESKSNGILDNVVDRVSIVWWTHGPGPSKIGVTHLVTASE